MRRELAKRISASLPAFTDDDKTAFLNFIASKYKSFDINEICFEPYKNAVVDAPTFYENATIIFFDCPIDKGDSFLLAEESFRGEETLTLRKSDGVIYYNSYTKPPFPVATSFLELWTKLESRRKEKNNVGDDEGKIEPAPPLEPTTEQTLRRCFTRDSFEKVRALYEAFNDDEALREFPYDGCGCEGINEFNFYQKANFSLYFPFTLVDQSTYDLPEGTWWEIGRSCEDEDTGPDDDGFFLTDSKTGRVIRCLELSLDYLEKKSWKSFVEKMFPLCSCLWRLLFRVKKTPTPTPVDYFQVAGSFRELIERLSANAPDAAERAR